MQLDLSDHLAFGGIITTCLTVLRVAERYFLRHMEQKKSGSNGVPKTVIVQLDPEVSRMIRETHENSDKLVEVVSVHDANGAPMVYAPRAILGRMDEKLDKLVNRAGGK